jgi:hypothetical protein
MPPSLPRSHETNRAELCIIDTTSFLSYPHGISYSEFPLRFDKIFTFATQNCLISHLRAVNALFLDIYIKKPEENFPGFSFGRSSFERRATI